jgi:hypothetical protein
MRDTPKGIIAETIEDCKKCKWFKDNKCEKFETIEDRFVCGAVEVIQ